ncbi:DUF1934 domain-containing protein [Neobacillus sp. D3-1R]|uniref:DUF1934 domain-containing protein n=1 Tax=Neobacillus sp. D3-1R TaxID=3445778 RepID=UPI003FA18181
MKAEQIPVKVWVKTDIFQGDQKETFELVTFGRYYNKGQSSYLLYEEVMDVGNIKTSVKFSEGEAVILRSGALNMRLAFKQDHQMRGHYDTPYGAMEMLTDTKRMAHNPSSERDGELDLVYDLTTQGEVAGTYHMKITYKEDAK